MPARAAGPDVAAAFAGLAETLARDLNIDAYLNAVCRHCVSLIAADCAAIVYAGGPGDEPLRVAASDDLSRGLATGGQDADGPWADCLRSGQLMTVADLRAKRARWPGFVRSAVGAGLTTATVVPIATQAGTVGALALLGGTAPDVAGILLALALADAAGAGLALSTEARRQETAITQLQTALSSRIVIEQAKGILAERWQIAPDEAFTALRRHARASQRGLSDIARAIIDGSIELARPDQVKPL